jgi:hypothetical protein
LLADPEYWPEDKATESHADGLFMERIGAQVPIYPIDIKVSQNRRTPRSTYVPVRCLPMIECLANGVPFVASQMGADLAVTATKSSTSAPTTAPLVTISITSSDRHANLPDVLASVAAQTYPHREVLVIAGDSLCDESARLWEEMQSRYPQFQFFDAEHFDSRAMRDRGLWQAQGVYFLAMGTDTLACPDMVERLVAGMRGNSHLSALTCYVLALQEALASCTVEPRLLASTRNIHHGGIFRTADLREAGGYGCDPDLAAQNWIGFLKLVNAGFHVDVLPEHLFQYRPQATGSLQTEDGSRKHERILRPFVRMDRQLAAERVALWTAFADMRRHLEELAEQNETLQAQNQALQTRCAALRYRIVDRLIQVGERIPFVSRSLRWLRNCQSSPSPDRLHG